VEAKEVLRKLVETSPSKLGVEMNPDLWRPDVVETRETPNPCVVEANEVLRRVVETRPSKLAEERNPAV
jgi:hypothetical protein